MLSLLPIHVPHTNPLSLIDPYTTQGSQPERQRERVREGQPESQGESLSERERE